MIGAVLAVRRAIQARLVADAPLLALLGGPHVHDEPPRAAPGPYVVHGDVEAEDWSSTGDIGCEQRLSLVVWAAKGAETRQALAIAGRVGEALHEAALALQGHRLVNLRQTGLDLTRDAKTGRSCATVRLRAVTEQL
jgi:hypothetical protein